MQVSDPSDPKVDRWLRKQPARIELALRYAIRGRLRNARQDARIDELFAKINPDEDELAAIIRHSRKIGANIEAHLGSADSIGRGGRS